MLKKGIAAPDNRRMSKRISMNTTGINATKNPLQGEVPSPLMERSQGHKEIKLKFEINTFQQERLTHAINYLVYGVRVTLVHRNPRTLNIVAQTLHNSNQSLGKGAKSKTYQQHSNRNNSSNFKVQIEHGWLCASDSSSEEVLFIAEDSGEMLVFDLYKIADIMGGLPVGWRLPRLKDFVLPDKEELYVHLTNLKNNADVAICFASKDERDFAWQGFQETVILCKTRAKQREESSSVNDILREIDTDYSENYSFHAHEVLDYIQRLHLRMTFAHFSHSYSEFIIKNLPKSIQQNSPLAQNVQAMNVPLTKQLIKEFLQKILERDELIPIYERLAQCTVEDPKERTMTQEHFKTFLKEQTTINGAAVDYNTQSSNVLLDKRVKELFQYLSPESPERISFLQFSMYIYSKANSFCDPARQRVYQPMTLSLQNYYVHCARLTYSCNFDVSKIYHTPIDKNDDDKSVTEVPWERKFMPLYFILSRGVRCLELDIWESEFEIVREDGQRDQKFLPCILFGHTMTSKVRLDEFLEKFMEHVFRTNPYPFFLYLNTHCSAELNAHAIDLIHQKIGVRLFSLPSNYLQTKDLPSPQDLLERVIVFGGVPQYALQAQEEAKIKNRKVQTSLESIDRELTDFFALDDELEAKKQTNLRDYLDLKKSAKKPRLKNFLEHKFVQEGGIHNTSGETANASITVKPCLLTDVQQSNTISLNTAGNLNSANVVASSGQAQKVSQQQQQQPNTVQIPEQIPNIRSLDVSKYLALRDGLVQLFSLFEIGFFKTVLPSLFEVYALNEEQAQQLQRSSSVNRFNASACMDYPDLHSFTRDHLLKINPRGKHIDMCNFATLFATGAQFIMNHPQTFDLQSLIYNSKFLENQCGYVLKPPEFRSTSAAMQRSLGLHIKLTLIAGYQLRQSKQAATYQNAQQQSTQKQAQTERPSVGDAPTMTQRQPEAAKKQQQKQQILVNPCVEIIVQQAQEKHSFLYKTEARPNNTLNPKWHSQFKFYAEQPDITFLIFQVVDTCQQSGVLLGWNSLPLSCLRPGYRSIPLRDQNFNTIKHSYLLCHFEITTH